MPAATRAMASSKEQSIESRKASDTTEDANDVPQFVPELANSKSPVTPALADGTPVLRWKSYCASRREATENCNGKSDADPQGKLVISLSTCSHSLNKEEEQGCEAREKEETVKCEKEVTEEGMEEEEEEAKEDEAAVSERENSVVDGSSPQEEISGSSIQQNLSVCQKTCGDVTSISEIAKKVRLRVKRARRATKPNLFQRKSSSTEGSGDASDEHNKAGSASKEQNNTDDAPCGNNECHPSHTCVESDSHETRPSQSVSAGEQNARYVVDKEIAEVACQSAKCNNTSVEDFVEHVNPGLRDSAAAESVSLGQPEDAYCASRGKYTESVPMVQSEDAYYANRGKPMIQQEDAYYVNSGKPVVLPEDVYYANRGRPMEQPGDVYYENRGKSVPLEYINELPVKGIPRENVNTVVNYNEHVIPSWKEEMNYPDSRECTWKERRNYSVYGRQHMRMHNSVQNPGLPHDAIRMDMRECAASEIPMPDEPPGYGIASSGRPDTRSCGPRVKSIHHQSADQGSDSYYHPTNVGTINGEPEHVYRRETRVRSSGNASNGAGLEANIADQEMVYRREARMRSSANVMNSCSPGTPGRGSGFSDHVPSMHSDAEGNGWQNQRMSLQMRENDNYRYPAHPYNESEGRARDFPSSSYDHTVDEVQQYGVRTESVPYGDLIPLNWRQQSDPSDIIWSQTAPKHRNKVVKERSIFVGCIPDGVQNLESLLQNLMDKFLERFDFAPAKLGWVQVVKAVKDFAFIELATVKVAQIVLAANQLDIFEWGVNGYHFNIQGCTATYTSVRPLIEYMPLKPSRVVLVSNIPKSRWRKEYLESFFQRILQETDGSTDVYIASVYLLPESSDAYVELTSELIADALMFKCIKNPGLLKEIGPDALICRDARSVPLMSRHRGTIDPQRSLFIGVSPGEEEFKIDTVIKIFIDALPFIAKKSNIRGYLEYVTVQPGKDYAFFQFSSEEFVDAIMDEYIETTQVFVCKSNSMSYIILRPPGYVRPGVTYGSGNDQSTGDDYSAETERMKRARSASLDQSGPVYVKPRRFGDEPIKKPDCIMSIGASPLQLGTWNGISSVETWSADPECMIVVEGLPLGIGYRLLCGALNELFERSLCQSGLLQSGMLVVRSLERDGKFDAVACLPNAAFVAALLSIREMFVVGGEEIRLFPRNQSSVNHLRGNNMAEFTGGHCELSSLSDEDSQGRAMAKENSVDECYDPRLMHQNKWEQNDMDAIYSPGCDITSSMGDGKDNNLDYEPGEWCPDEQWNASPPVKENFRSSSIESSQIRNVPEENRHPSYNLPYRARNSYPGGSEELYCEGNNPRVRNPYLHKGSGRYNNGPGRYSDGRFSDGPARFSDGPGRFPDGPGKFTAGPGRLTDGPGRFTDGPGRLTDGPGRLTDGPGRFTDGPGRFTDGPGRFTDGPGRFTDGPGRFTDGPGRFADVHINDGQTGMRRKFPQDEGLQIVSREGKRVIRQTDSPSMHDMGDYRKRKLSGSWQGPSMPVKGFNHRKMTCTQFP